MKNQKKKSKIKWLDVFDKKKIVFTDLPHITGNGDFNAIKPYILKRHYGIMNFSFLYLEQANDYFKGIFGKKFDCENIRVYFPQGDKYGPIIFVYGQTMAHRKGKEKLRFFAIAPRVENE